MRWPNRTSRDERAQGGGARGTRVILALAGAVATIVLLAPPAGAHPYFTPLTASVGQPASLALAVDSHFTTDLVRVEVDAPLGFDLTGAKATEDWTEVLGTAAGTVAFTGSLAPGRTAFFTIRGTATKKGELVFPLVTSSAAGETMRWDLGCLAPSPSKGGLLYVDVDPEEVCDDTGGGSTNLAPIFGGIAAVVGVGLGVAVVLRRRR